jgi:RNA polymerase sigma-70 factor (ECF subfamily)
MQVIEALPRYEQRGLPFNAWVFRIARNAVIDAARRTRDTDPLETALTVEERARGPAELAEAADERLALVDAIASLTPEQRDVIAQRFFADLSVAEVAAVLGKRPGTVRVVQFRALAALRRRLASATGQQRSEAVVEADAP